MHTLLGKDNYKQTPHTLGQNIVTGKIDRDGSGKIRTYTAWTVTGKMHTHILDTNG